MLARLNLDGVGLDRVERLRGFAVVQDEGVGIFRGCHRLNH